MPLQKITFRPGINREGTAYDNEGGWFDCNLVRFRKGRPEKFGGWGMDAAAAVIVHEELAAVDPGFTLAYLAHSMLFVNNLAQNGSEAQCQKYLPGAATGELIGGMCMSEPAVGTDVLGMQTMAKRDGDSYVINGAKMWITNGAISDTELGDVFLVYARTGESKKTASLFLVEKGTPGFSLGQKIHDKLGMRASTTAELVFEDCRIPAENLVGSEGEAVKHMMRNLEIERLTLAAMSLGIARRSIEIMNRYANERHAFGKPLREFLFVDDLAAAVIHTLETDLPEHLYNIGTGKDLTIKELALIIQKIIGHKGDIVWDTSKPDGTPRKLLDVSKMKAIGWQYSTELEVGVKKTYTWFLENINNFKEVKL